MLIIQLTDGGLGDDDLTANGVIVDQGGPGTPRAAQVPILMPLGIVALIGLLSIIVTNTLLKKRKS